MWRIKSRIKWLAEHFRLYIICQQQRRPSKALDLFIHVNTKRLLLIKPIRKLYEKFKKFLFIKRIFQTQSCITRLVTTWFQSAGETHNKLCGLELKLRDLHMKICKQGSWCESGFAGPHYSGIQIIFLPPV